LEHPFILHCFAFLVIYIVYYKQMKKCNNCRTESEIIRSAVKNGEYIEGFCDNCLAAYRPTALYGRQYERQWQRREYAKDIIQSFDPEFIKVYPDKAKEAGWSDEDIRQYG